MTISSGPAAAGATTGRFGEQLADGACAGGGVAGGVEPAAGGRHDLERPSGRRRGNRSAGGERFDQRETERLAVGAVEQEVRVRERGARVVDLAEEADTPGQVGARGALMQRLRVAGRSPGSGAPAMSSRSSGT